MSADGIPHTSPFMSAHFDKLRAVDPNQARTLYSWLHATEASDRKATEETTGLATYTDLRSAISSDPTKFDTARIAQQAKAGRLTASQVGGLYDDFDKASRAYKEFPALTGTLINGQRSEIKAAITKGSYGPIGQQAIDANEAQAQYNEIASAYLRANPKASEYELYKEMTPHVSRLAANFNTDIASTLEQPKIAAQVEKAKVQTDQIAQRDQMAERDRPPTAKELTNLLTSEEKQSLLATLKTTYEPGVSTKPTSENAVQDKLISILRSHYSGQPARLSAAVESLMREYRTFAGKK